MKRREFFSALPVLPLTVAIAVPKDDAEHLERLFPLLREMINECDAILIDPNSRQARNLT